MNARKFFSRVGFSYFILIVLMIGIEIVLDLIIRAAAPQILNRYPSMYWVVNFLPQYLIAMPVCLLILRRLPAMQINEGRIGGRRWFRMLCISLFILEAGGIIGDYICQLFERFSTTGTSSATAEMMSTGNLWVVFLFSVILAPVMEELVYRKALIDRAIVFGDRTAIILSGLLFGLIHGNFEQFFYAFGLGCLFAYIYIRTGKIRHTILFHMIINFLGGYVGTLLSTVLSNSMSEVSYYGNMNILISHLGVIIGLLGLRVLTYALAIVGIVLFIITFRRRTLLPGEYGMPAKQTCGAMFGNLGMILFLIISAVMFVSSVL